MTNHSVSILMFLFSRISRATQNIDRQIRNILEIYKDAKLYKEADTGTKREGRKEFEKLLKAVRSGDTIVFDSVSRMSRNAEEGVKLYFELYDKGINLVFLKEKHINTETYKTALNNTVQPTGNDIADIYIDATNKLFRLLAEKQIILAFEQAEKEVTDLRKRTFEGVETARRNGKQIGQQEGRTLNVKKKAPAQAIILKHSRDFNGTLNDIECMKLTGLSRNTYYKYKRELIVSTTNNI